ncbi:MAG: HemK2/MTQ2 family protein methyltransferase [Nanoarchaeota archaeon]
MKSNLIYQPAEDSYLLQKAISNYLKKKKINKFLDMGSGTGILARTAIINGIKKENIFLIDINKEAIKQLKEKFPKSEVIKSDLFSEIKDKIRFDLIVINPPYLPEDKREDKESGIATTGGKKGSEIINRFLKQAKNYLNKNGRILLLTSSLTKGIEWNGWKKKIINKEKLFFEELVVWEVRGVRV